MVVLVYRRPKRKELIFISRFFYVSQLLQALSIAHLSFDLYDPANLIFLLWLIKHLLRKEPNLLITQFFFFSNILLTSRLRVAELNYME
jgi:hypothetical protein